MEVPYEAEFWLPVAAVSILDAPLRGLGCRRATNHGFEAGYAGEFDAGRYRLYLDEIEFLKCCLPYLMCSVVRAYTGVTGSDGFVEIFFMILFLRKLLFVLFVAVLVSGCGILAGVYEVPYVDSVKNEDGSTTVLDTPRMWNMWVTKIDDDIRYEVSGRKPFRFGDGLNAWRDTWEYALITPLKNQENRRKYKDYLVISRRVAGLPELDVRIDLSEY